LVALGHRLGLTPEQLKAWSQNLGHEHVLTTLVSYSDVPAERQAEIIRALAEQPEPDAVAIEVTKRLLEVVRQHSVT
jgi:hypothetical protein